MIDYLKFKYIYPPRPKNAVPVSDLDFYSSKMYISQPKLNGSNCLIFTDGIKYYVMNRHGDRLTKFELTESEVLSLHVGEKGKWIVLNGEYMNKNKKGSDGKPWNHKLVLFDILVFNSKQLVGESFHSRIKLMDNIYGNEEDISEEFLYHISDNIKMVKSYIGRTSDIYEKLVKIDMYEGVVIKRKSSKLENGISIDNNSKTQCKCRKPTKNYNF